MRKTTIMVPVFLFGLALFAPSCQEDYILEIEDRPTETIEFSGITASRDTVCMFDTIVLTANANGENLRYIWQRAKGSMVAVKGEANKVYFWGCQTCFGDLTVSCTVENDFGAYTKNIDVFVNPWYSWQEPWPKEKLEKWLELTQNKK